MRRLAASILLSGIVFFTFFASPVSAKVITGEKGTVNIAKTEIINDDLFIGAESVELSGTVNGDVFIGAQSIKITGVINGSLHAGANNIDLGGNIKGNVYAGAQNINLNSASIGGSLIAAAAAINTDSKSIIGGSVIAGAGSLSFDSQVKRSMYVGTGSLTLGSTAKIGKDLYYPAGNDDGGASISDTATVSGKIYKSEINAGKKDVAAVQKEAVGFFKTAKIVSIVMSFVSALIVGFLYFKFFPKSSANVSKLIYSSFWKCMGIGFLVSIALIPGLIILLITVIGIPLAGLVLLFFLIYMYLSKIVVGKAFGEWLSSRFNLKKVSPFWVFVLGLAAIYLLKSVIIIGFLSGLIVFWVGLGALSLELVSKSE